MKRLWGGRSKLQATSSGPALPAHQSAESNGDDNIDTDGDDKVDDMREAGRPKRTASTGSVFPSRVSSRASSSSDGDERGDDPWEEEDGSASGGWQYVASEVNSRIAAEVVKQQRLTLVSLVDQAVKLAHRACRHHLLRGDVEDVLQVKPEMKSRVAARSCQSKSTDSKVFAISAWTRLPVDIEHRNTPLHIKQRIANGAPVDNADVERPPCGDFGELLLELEAPHWLNDEEKQLLDQFVRLLNSYAREMQSQLLELSGHAAFRGVRPVLAQFLILRVHDYVTFAPLWQLEQFVGVLETTALAPGHAELCIHQCLLSAFVVCLSPRLGSSSPSNSSFGSIRKAAAAVISKIALRYQDSIPELLPQICDCFQHALECASSFAIVIGAVWGLINLGAECVGRVLLPVLRCKPALLHADQPDVAEVNPDGCRLGDADRVEVAVALQGAAAAIVSRMDPFPATEMLRDAAFLYEEAAQLIGLDPTPLVSSLRALYRAQPLLEASGRDVWEPLASCL
mmetsp:Transcript_82027/g.145341  ORF Transcript_82027/g.145341 Transcript_82027/m.145341 type:complete len:512 (+) Transcript_82027:138-1673(+)